MCELFLGKSPHPAQFYLDHRTTMVTVGDKIPSATLFEGSPGNDAIIVGVPGAFSPACSASHVPGYLNHLRALQDKGVDSVYVVGVNDAFVMKAWRQCVGGSDKVRFLADPKGEFSQAWDVLFEVSKSFGNARTRRFAVTHAFVEPDNVSVDVSCAEAVLKSI
ncbi:putative thioredoxin peroxidase [Metschnikowia bicuspidata]|uniref:Putative thioredoxin peroxidase n=1 Tax=Metschnikowia bicuspidata TaxID=27322 RepID=A0A4P9ZB78_9ASCO|nr:putative thioredoxin peroxidase [Metschnikowia bicuspidata]